MYPKEEKEDGLYTKNTYIAVKIILPPKIISTITRGVQVALSRIIP